MDVNVAEGKTPSERSPLRSDFQGTLFSYQIQVWPQRGCTRGQTVRLRRCHAKWPREQGAVEPRPDQLQVGEGAGQDWAVPQQPLWRDPLRWAHRHSCPEPDGRHLWTLPTAWIS